MSQASSPFEALISVCLSRYQSDVIPPIQMRWSTTAFFRVSIGDSDIPLSCEMKHEPEFKPLQGNPAFFWVRVSRGPFPLRQETQGISHIPISERKLHFRCWWKVVSNLQSKTGNQLSSWDNMGCMEFSSSWCTDINIHMDLRRVSQGISVNSSRKSSYLYCMLWNMGQLRSKRGGNGIHPVLISATPSYFAFLSWHQSSSRLVTVFLGTVWCSIKKIEAPYLFHWEYDIALHEMQGNQASSPSEAYVSWDFPSCGRIVGYILELQRAWPLETPLCSETSGLMSSYDRHLRNIN